MGISVSVGGHPQTESTKYEISSVRACRRIVNVHEHAGPEKPIL